MVNWRNEGVTIKRKDSLLDAGVVVERQPANTSERNDQRGAWTTSLTYRQDRGITDMTPEVCEDMAS